MPLATNELFAKKYCCNYPSKKAYNECRELVVAENQNNLRTFSVDCGENCNHFNLLELNVSKLVRMGG